MPRLQGRLDKLEKTLTPLKGPLERFRVLADRVGSLNLATSRCTRTLRGGMLTEIVILSGSRDHLSDEQLEKFIESFPTREGAQT
jgi:hypothetical protein